MTRTMIRSVALAAMAALAPVSALAHDVTYALRGSGEVDIAFIYQDGTPMAGATAMVFEPGAGALPTTTAMTDAAGEVRVHVPIDGVWHVDVRDEAGHASRARIRVEGGVPTRAERGIPDWLAAGSLVLNLLLVFRVATTLRRHRIQVRRDAAFQPVNRGSLPT